VRFAIGVGFGASYLLGCSGGVLDVGSSDAGDPRQASPAPSAYSAAAVQRARQRCTPVSPIYPWKSYPQPDLKSELTGGWLLCYWLAPADARSFQFTADGHWYTLVDDGEGGLKRAGPGYDGGPIGSQGTYTFRDGNGEPSGPNGAAVFVATEGTLWFHPEFTELTGRMMSMNFLTDGTHDTCVLIEP